MALGALVCLIVGGLVRVAQPIADAYYPGSVLYSLGDVVFLTAPLVVWMIFRHRGRRHALELATAASVPMLVAIMLAGGMAQRDLGWLVYAMYPAISLILLAYMWTRREVFATA